MTDRQQFILINPRVRQNAIEAVRSAAPDSVVSVAPKKRTTAQNAKMWAMLADVARSKPEGRQWAKETWKAAFLHFLGHQVQFAEGLDGSGPFPLGFRSSSLTVKQMIDLIDCIYAYGTQHGVEWRETRAGGHFDMEAA